MKIQKTNAIIDIFAFISAILSFFTGIILYLKFPAGEKTGRLIYWGFTKFQWIDLHVYTSFALLALVLIHLLLHWNWIKNLKCILLSK